MKKFLEECGLGILFVIAFGCVIYFAITCERNEYIDVQTYTYKINIDKHTSLEVNASRCSDWIRHKLGSDIVNMLECEHPVTGQVYKGQYYSYEVVGIGESYRLPDSSCKGW